ncbi:MAG: TIGR03118 family protein [Acidobacteria bacterium]|nr:TIGR03118 family protein [Acidobacteriota bacterium]
MRSSKHLGCLAALFAAALVSNPAYSATNFVQKNLVADVAGVADNTDPNLLGTWGISTSPASPFWVSNATNGTSTLYNTAGVPNALVVTVPPSASNPGRSGSPTGQVWNGTGAFEVAPGRVPSFIFATLDGTISGFSGAVGTTAVIKVDNGARGAAYFGLAIGVSSAGPALYAANFASGKIDVFDRNYAPLTLPGGFRDLDLAPGYSPSNIQRFGRLLYVTYNLPDGRGGFVYGPATGLINLFDLDGNLVQRLVPISGHLNTPWGVALAGPNFGIFSYALLVGNFGDGTISAYDSVTGNYLGSMEDGKGSKIAIDGLWGLQFGNGGNGGEPRTLYFAAAPVGGQHGLFGALTPAADSNTP